VEEVEPNMEKNQVIVKGTACDPVRIAARVKHKLGKRVAIISPVPIKKQEKKEETPKVTETVLKMHLHCEVRHSLLKMKGVESAEPDMNASTVTVKGTVDPKDLTALIYKKTRKRAEVVIPKKQKDQNQNQNDGKEKPKKKKDQNQNQNDGKKKPKKQKDHNQNQNDGKEKDAEKKEENDSEKKDGRTIGLSYPSNPRGFDYATEIFSDENTDACSIM
ncbi:heavy metal-associated isoprenylated plant protein 8-like protein, partial [Tanacetum coccineum]